MVSLAYFHICDYAFGAEGGKHCIIGIFDEIAASEFPLKLPLMTLAIKLKGQSREAVTFAIEIQRPNGEPLGSVDGGGSMLPDGSVCANLTLQNATFPEPGRYTFNLLLDGAVAASQYLTLHQAQSPDPQPDSLTTKH